MCLRGVIGLVAKPLGAFLISASDRRFLQLGLQSCFSILPFGRDCWGACVCASLASEYFEGELVSGHHWQRVVISILAFVMGGGVGEGGEGMLACLALRIEGG